MAKQERDKANGLTLFHGGEEIYVPVSRVATGRIFSEFPPVIQRYEQALKVPIPPVVLAYQDIVDPEEKARYQAEHLVEIATWHGDIAGQLATIKAGHGNAEGVIAKFQYLKEAIRVLADRPNIDAKTLALIDGNELWEGEQDMEAVEEHVIRFRRRLA